MSDNVQDELEDIICELDGHPDGVVQEVKAVLAHLAERGMVVLGPDGEPVRLKRFISPSTDHFVLYIAAAEVEG